MRLSKVCSCNPKPAHPPPLTQPGLLAGYHPPNLASRSRRDMVRPHHPWVRIPTHNHFPLQSHPALTTEGSLRAHCSLWLKCATGCGSSPPQTERLHT